MINTGPHIYGKKEGSVYTGPTNLHDTMHKMCGVWGDEFKSKNVGRAPEYGQRLKPDLTYTRTADPLDVESCLGPPIGFAPPPFYRGSVCIPAHFPPSVELYAAAQGTAYPSMYSQLRAERGWGVQAAAAESYGPKDPHGRTIKSEETSAVENYRQAMMLLLPMIDDVKHGRIKLTASRQWKYWNLHNIGVNVEAYSGIQGSRHGRNKGMSYDYLVRQAAWTMRLCEIDPTLRNYVVRLGSRDKVTGGLVEELLKCRAVFQPEGCESFIDRIIACASINGWNPDCMSGGPTSGWASGANGQMPFLINTAHSTLHTEAADWRRFDNAMHVYQQWAAIALMFALGEDTEEWLNLCCYACARHCLVYFIDPRGIIRKLAGGNPSGRGLVSDINSIANFLELRRCRGNRTGKILTSGDDHLALGCSPGIHERVSHMTGWEPRNIERTPLALGASMLGYRFYGMFYERDERKILDLLTTSKQPYWKDGNAGLRAAMLTKDSTHVGHTTGRLGMFGHFRTLAFIDYPRDGYTQAADVRIASTNHYTRCMNIPYRNVSYLSLQSTASSFPQYETDNHHRSLLGMPPNFRVEHFPREDGADLCRNARNLAAFEERERVAKLLDARKRMTYFSTHTPGMRPTTGYITPEEIVHSREAWHRLWQTNVKDRIADVVDPLSQLAYKNARVDIHNEIREFADVKQYIHRNKPLVVENAPPKIDMALVSILLSNILRTKQSNGFSQVKSMFRRRDLIPAHRHYSAFEVAHRMLMGL